MIGEARKILVKHANNPVSEEVLCAGSKETLKMPQQPKDNPISVMLSIKISQDHQHGITFHFYLVISLFFYSADVGMDSFCSINTHTYIFFVLNLSKIKTQKETLWKKE